MERIEHRYNIVEYPDFLTPEECDAIIKYYEDGKELWQETCFFNARVMDPNAPLNAGIDNNIVNPDFFSALKEKMKKYGEDAMGRELRNLTFSAHKWYPGAFANDHYDNAELDKTPNAWQDNKMVTIVYLNDNYEGGNLTFNEHGLSIAPKKGTMIAFDVGIENLHGVDKVISGTRYTMMCSFDWADSVYPEGYLEALKAGKAEVDPIHEEQRKEWRELDDFYDDTNK